MCANVKEKVSEIEKKSELILYGGSSFSILAIYYTMYFYHISILHAFYFAMRHWRAR